MGNLIDPKPPPSTKPAPQQLVDATQFIQSQEIEDDETENLDPRVRQFLLNPSQYTSVSLPIGPAGTAATEKPTLDPELVALKALPKLQDRLELFQIFVTLQRYHSQLIENQKRVCNKQDTITQEIRLFEIKVRLAAQQAVNTTHEVNFFQSTLKTLPIVQQSISIARQNLEVCVRKTFSIFEAIPLEFRPSILPTFEVLKPFLRKDHYVSSHLFGETPHALILNQIERTNEDLWLQHILPNWGHAIAQHKAIGWWRNGVPSRLRPYAWKRLIGNQLEITVELYTELAQTIQLGPQEADGVELKKRATTKELIIRDIPRTFQALPFFQDSEQPCFHQLLQVLEMFVVYTHSDYVQGMSHIAGLLLLFMNQYDTFVAFCNLMENPFLKNVYQLDLSAMSKHSQLFQMIFHYNLPSLHEHFNNLSVTTEHFLLEWWLTLFTKSTDLSVAPRIWDCFLIEGELFLHIVAVAILFVFQHELIHYSADELLNSLSQIPRRTNNTQLFDAVRRIYITPKIETVFHEIHLGSPRLPFLDGIHTQSTNSPIGVHYVMPSRPFQPVELSSVAPSEATQPPPEAIQSPPEATQSSETIQPPETTQLSPEATQSPPEAIQSPLEAAQPLPEATEPIQPTETIQPPSEAIQPPLETIQPPPEPTQPPLEATQLSSETTQALEAEEEISANSPPEIISSPEPSKQNENQEPETPSQAEGSFENFVV